MHLHTLAPGTCPPGAIYGIFLSLEFPLDEETEFHPPLPEASISFTIVFPDAKPSTSLTNGSISDSSKTSFTFI